MIDISLAFFQHLVNFQLKKHTFVLAVAVNIDTSRHRGEKGCEYVHSRVGHGVHNHKER